MKLLDIIEATMFKGGRMVPLKTPAPVDRDWDDNIGAGSFAAVFKQGKNVMKELSYYRELQRDAWFQYAQHIFYNHLADKNPYYPRIYSITLSAGGVSEDAAKYNIEMERLYVPSEISLNAMKAATKKMFSIDDAILPSFKNTDELQRYIVELLGACSNYLQRTYDASRIIDPKLKEAMDFVQKIVEMSRKNFFDVHTENIMWRKNPNGTVHMVLSDPLADS